MYLINVVHRGKKEGHNSFQISTVTHLDENNTKEINGYVAEGIMLKIYIYKNRKEKPPLPLTNRIRGLGDPIQSPDGS